MSEVYILENVVLFIRFNRGKSFNIQNSAVTLLQRQSHVHVSRIDPFAQKKKFIITMMLKPKYNLIG